jgi:protein phosphatase-4 regulatory subunit 3
MLTIHSDGLRKKWQDEEDDWFIGSDDDEYPPIGPQPPWIQHQLANQPPRKKRRFKPGLTLEWTRKKQPPNPTPANSPQSSGLVDYEGDDDNAPSSSETTPKSAESSKPPASFPTVAISTTLSQHTSPTTPSLRVKAPQPIKLPTLGATTELLTVSESPTEEAEVEPLINGATPSPSTPDAPQPPPPRGDKRRREEDDDDLLVRLASKTKKREVDATRPSSSPSPSPAVTSESESKGPGPVASKKEEGTAKKIRLRLGSIASVVTRRASREAEKTDGG